jgi:hypothetical protein
MHFSESELHSASVTGARQMTDSVSFMWRDAMDFCHRHRYVT